MDAGSVVERGVHAELIAGDTLYRRMFGAAELEGTTLDAADDLAGDVRGGDGRDTRHAGSVS
jgi:hypothetical protein